MNQDKEIPDGAKVKIHGFVMLKGLDDGKTYTVKRDDKKKIYWFCGPRSGKKLIGHFFDNVNGSLECFRRGDLNSIEILSAETKTKTHE